MKKTFAIFFFFFLMLSACASPAPAQPTSMPTQVSQPGATTSAPVAPTEAPAPTNLPPTAEPTAIPTPVPPTPTDVPLQFEMAHIDKSGNVNVLDMTTGTSSAITNDAGSDPTKPMVFYGDPLFSSDGKYIAYSRSEALPQADQSYKEINTLIIHSFEGNTDTVISLEMGGSGYSWKPQTHLLTYTVGVPTEYFIGDGHSLAKGVYALDLDKGGESELLVPPKDLTLMGPHWSPDGKYLYVQEIMAMEGGGEIARFDPATKAYDQYKQVIGYYDISPAEPKMAFDLLNYAPAGNEIIHVSNLELNSTVDLTKSDGTEFHSHPKFSPDGKWIAFVAAKPFVDFEQQESRLMIVPTDGSSAPEQVFTGAGVLDPGWMPDGKSLLVFVGTYESPRIVQVILADKSVKELAEGRGWSVVQK